jgi:hypothetical protein
MEGIFYVYTKESGSMNIACDRDVVNEYKFYSVNIEDFVGAKKSYTLLDIKLPSLPYNQVSTF